MKRINFWKLIKTVIRAFMQDAPTPVPEPTPTPVPEPTPAPPTFGVVRINGRAFEDDRGPFNAVGTSLFWALWGERYDADRLDIRNLRVVRGRVDYIRILAMVGSESWSDRVIDPRWPDYWSTVDALFARLRRLQLRAAVTVFADAQVMMPEPGDRALFAQAWADAIRDKYAQDVIFVEVANEYWQNGVSRDELRPLGHILQGSGVPVALSAPTDDDVCGVYGGWNGIATVHYDRDISKADGVYRPIRQPWGYPAEYREREGYHGPMPDVAVNGEPIGPESSVAADDSPERIALAAATTFIAGGAAYCFHTGAGIRGGGMIDRLRGRRANLDEYSIDFWRGLSTLDFTLVPGQANGRRENAQWSTMPWDGSQHAVDRGDLVRAYASITGRAVRAVFIGTKAPHTITLRESMAFSLVDPVTADIVMAHVLPAGSQVVIPGGRDGLIFVGQIQS